jgi:hypothetical protein
MSQFEIEEMTTCTVANVNVRSELHGEDHVPAVDVSLKLTTSNDILSQFDGALKGMLYGKADKAARAAQAEIDGVDPVSDMPKLRCTVIEQPIKLSKEYIGYRLVIEIGLGQMVIEQCGVKKIRANCMEGGTVELSFQVQAANLDEATLGKLATLIGNEVDLTLTAPIDGGGQRLVDE